MKEVFLTIQHINPTDFDQNEHASTNGSKTPHDNRKVRVATLHADIQEKGRTISVVCHKCFAEALKNSRICSKSSPDRPASGQSPTN